MLLVFPRSGEGYQKHSATLKILMNIVASIILKWKTFKLFIELPLGQTEQSGEKGLGQGGEQEPNGHSDRAPEFLSGDGRTFQKDIHLCSPTLFRPL
jgi:hypothetical protein